MADLGALYVVDEGAAGGDFGAGEAAECVHRVDPELRFEAAFGVVGVEKAGGEDGGVFGVFEVLFKFFFWAVGEEDFFGVYSRESGFEVVCAIIPLGALDGERTRREIDPGDAVFAADFGDGGEVVVFAWGEERVLGQCALGDEADDVAVDEGFGGGAAFGFGAGFCFVGGFGLFANRDFIAFADELFEVGLNGMEWDSAHGDICAISFAAFGEGDVEDFGGDEGVVEEEFVEITHAVEEQRVIIAIFDGQILRHHRRVTGGDVFVGGVLRCFYFFLNHGFHGHHGILRLQIV